MAPLIQEIEDLVDETPVFPQARRRKLRIAVLDTGIDTDAILFETALYNGRIKACSFVGKPEEYHDSHGHGSHVARILLERAPAAELYIAKIAKGKNISADELHRIPEVRRFF